MENQTDGTLPKEKVNTLFERLKNTFLEEFSPIANPQHCSIFMSTEEIFEKFQSVYPSIDYTCLQVAEWLDSMGFKFTSISPERILWMLEASGKAEKKTS